MAAENNFENEIHNAPISRICNPCSTNAGFKYTNKSQKTKKTSRNL